MDDLIPLLSAFPSTFQCTPYYCVALRYSEHAGDKAHLFGYKPFDVTTSPLFMRRRNQILSIETHLDSLHNRFIAAMPLLMQTGKPRVILGLMTFGPDSSAGARITSLDEYNKCLDYLQSQG